MIMFANLLVLMLLHTRCFDLNVGRFKISSVDTYSEEASRSFDDPNILLQDTTCHDPSKGGSWGNGEHPTTKLCLNFLEKSVKPGTKVLDYGCGSGILSIVAAKLGAKNVLGVEVDDASLEASIANCAINGVSEIVECVHTREIYIGEPRFADAIADVTVANILPGPLTRLVSPLWGFTKSGGRFCLSGMRPEELAAVRELYLELIDPSSEETYSASHDAFGEWVAWSAQFRAMNSEERWHMQRKLSDLATETMPF